MYKEAELNSFIMFYSCVSVRISNLVFREWRFDKVTVTIKLHRCNSKIGLLCKVTTALFFLLSASFLIKAIINAVYKEEKRGKFLFFLSPIKTA